MSKEKIRTVTLDIDNKLLQQKQITADYLNGKIDIDEYKQKMDKVATPIDLVKLASNLRTILK